MAIPTRPITSRSLPTGRRSAAPSHRTSRTSSSSAPTAACEERQGAQSMKTRIGLIVAGSRPGAVERHGARPTLKNVENAYESDAGHVLLPANAGGQVIIRECAELQARRAPRERRDGLFLGRVARAPRCRSTRCAGRNRRRRGRPAADRLLQPRIQRRDPHRAGRRLIPATPQRSYRHEYPIHRLASLVLGAVAWPGRVAGDRRRHRAVRRHAATRPSPARSRTSCSSTTTPAAWTARC